MSLPAAEELSSLATLAADLLYVFVAGPGKGEGIAVALPGGEWLFVDGCKTSAAYPLRSIFDRFRRPGDSVGGVVLTHPHEDHAWGVAELITELSPRFVGVAGTSTPLSTLLDQFEDLRTKTDPRVTSDALKVGVVRKAVGAVQRFADGAPNRLIALSAGVTLPVTSAVTVRVQGPEPALLGTFLSLPSEETWRRANEVSTVLELEFAGTRVVLGGDLPRFATGSKRALPMGWEEVITRRPELGAHHGLKLPHHGSEEAYHPGLHTDGPARAWWLTPFSSARLPRVQELGGLPQLLKRQTPLHLTALPSSRRAQSVVQHPGIVRLDQLKPRRAPASGVRLVDQGLLVKPAQEPEPLEPLWVTAFDAVGNVTGRWRGGVALEIAKARPSPKKKPKAVRKKKKSRAR